MFEGKRVLVLGLARSGKAAIRLLEHEHAIITVNESKPKEKIPEYEAYTARGIEMVCGGQPEELFERDFDFCVKNPGINYHAWFILRLKERGIPVLTEIELGYQICQPQNYIAVTGTNGKTTTVSLIYEILLKAGRKAHICGNYGIPYCDVVMDEKLYEETGHDIVLEMSNFQLIDIDTFKPQIATCLNLTPDHLDYMDSLDEYYASKMRIYMNQDAHDLYINNIDDTTLQGYLQRYSVPSQMMTFSVAQEADCMLKGDMIYFLNQPFLSRQEIKIVGLHNVANIMVAIIAAYQAGVDLETIRETIRNFKGVEHRIEYVRTLDGVTYYNDSKGTNTDATIIALKAFDHPVILLMGGFEKGLDLAELASYNDHISKLICFGAAGARFARDMHHPKTMTVAHLADAVACAREAAHDGDVVLLSPSTSSFDEFSCYEERGEVFKEIVNHLD